eukprot:gene30018-37471_t
MGLTDLLEHTQFLSLQFQTVNTLPWEQRQQMREFETLFKFLLEELRATAHGAQRFPLHNMPYFADKLEEFKKGKFAGVSLLGCANKRNSLEHVMVKLADWCEVVLHFFQARVVSDIPSQFAIMA